MSRAALHATTASHASAAGTPDRPVAPTSPAVMPNVDRWLATAMRVGGAAFTVVWLAALLSFPLVKGVPAGYVPVALGVGFAALVAAGRRPITRALMAMPRRAFIASVLVAGALTRLAIAAVVPLAPANDHEMFYRLALGLLEGRGYVTSAGMPTAFFPPGMSFAIAAWLALVPASPFAPAALGLLVGVLLVLATFLFAESIGLPQPTARWGTVLVALSPTLVAYSTTVGYEPLLGLVLLATMALASTTGTARGAWLGRIGALGALAGAGALIKPVYLLVPALLGVLWAPRRGLGPASRDAILVALVMILVILPWTARNWRALGSPVLISTNGGVVLYSANNPTSRGIASPVEPLPGEVDEVSRDTLRRAAAVRWILSNPADWIRLAALKAVYGWGTTSSVMSFISADRMIPSDEDLLKGGLNVGWAALFTWCALAALRSRVWGDERLRGVLLFTLCLFAVHLVFEALSRHHIPVIPVLALVAAEWLGDDRRASGAVATG